MLETNLRIVLPGPSLSVDVRRLKVSGSDPTADLRERACGTIRRRLGLAAVSAPNDRHSLLAAVAESIRPLRLRDDDWELDVSDAGDPLLSLSFTDSIGQTLLPTLLERALMVAIAQRTKFCSLDSPRLWYQPDPFQVTDGIAAHRRYELGAIVIDDVGVGLAIDIGTAFFTVQTLKYFFDATVTSTERSRRVREFNNLTARQRGQKGTLLYDNGSSWSKCYYESAPGGLTCATTPHIRVHGRSYDNLFTYYRDVYPSLCIAPDAPAIWVSFPGIERSQAIAAERVRVRVMNDELPSSLSQTDKIEPAERRRLVNEFWDGLGDCPLGQVAGGVESELWKPAPARILQIPPPGLRFGGGECIPASTVASVDAYRASFRQRRQKLGSAGCYSVPIAMTRVLYCAAPTALDEETSRRLARDVAALIAGMTGRRFEAQVIPYESIENAVAKLRAIGDGGAALVILDDEPTGYHEVSFQLSDWRIKRVTDRVLAEHYRYLTEGAWDRRLKQRTKEAGQLRWSGFVELTALDLMQSLDVLPFRVDTVGIYEAQVAIDVGHDRRHFAISVLIARDQGRNPDFRLITHTYPKTDHQHEAINPVILAEKLVRAIEAALGRQADPIDSVLVVRDGRLVADEASGLEAGFQKLRQRGCITSTARIDYAELHKDMMKSVRLWDVQASERVLNPLECTLLRLGNANVVVTTTGAASLHQGTADPFLVVANGHCAQIMDAAVALCSASQLNWSSPGVAQRLPLQFKRTDEELTSRASQEIRRLH